MKLISDWAVPFGLFGLFVSLNKYLNSFSYRETADIFPLVISHLMTVVWYRNHIGAGLLQTDICSGHCNAYSFTSLIYT